MRKDQRKELQARMHRLFVQWKSGSETATAFSKRHGITPWKFQYWRDRFRHEDGDEKTSFAPVHLVNDGWRGDASSIEVVLASGETIRVRNEASLEMVRGVLSILRERC